MELGNSQGLDSRTADELCEMAKDPKQAQALTEYLGADQYHQLVEAVQGGSRSASRAAPGGTIVLLHGIMGSQIGKRPRGVRREWDIVWMNPLAVRDGNFSLLKLGAGNSSYTARGLLPMFYALLWARMKYWYRYNIVEFAYDWRLGIQESGDALVEFINEDTTGPIYIVAHSMGGLVSRAAASKLDSRVQRIVQLASPNYGSFSPVITLRGQNEFVNKFLKLDSSSTVTDLISNTVSTFQGLYEMFPAPARFSGVNLFDSGIWPPSPAINTTVLAKARTGIEKLPGPDRRFVLIAGNNQDTITDMSIEPSGEFRFLTTISGDGTVPLNFARFDASAQVPTYLANVTHNGIISDGTVSAALDDILRTGQTGRLPRDTGEQRRTEAKRAFDTSRALDPLQGRNVDTLNPTEVRTIQREFFGPIQPLGGGPTSTVGVAPSPGGMSNELIHAGFKNVVVGRRRRRIRVVLANGDITQMPCHAHVLAVFEGVTPSGAAVAFDKLLDGAISDLFERQMFSAARGRVYFIPTYKTAVPGELLVFAGLGGFSDFQPDVVEHVARQTAQSLLHVRVNELATVIFGGSLDDYPRFLYSMLKGFIDGLNEADHNFEFQRLVLVENDAGKFLELQRELYRLASSELFDDTEVEFDVITLPNRGTTRGVVTLPSPSDLPVVVLSRLSIDVAASGRDTMYHHEITILPPRSGTSIPRFTHQYSKADFDSLVSVTQNGAPTNLDDFGTKLANLVLPSALLAGCEDMVAHFSVQLLHDSLSSRIPWEAMKIAGVSPALVKGISRKYERNPSATMFSRTQQHNQTLRVLLVYNPTQDLPGAESEGERIQKVTAKWGGQMQVIRLHGSEATRDAIIDRLSKESFDVLHYAGHAGFVPDNPTQSGLLCAGRQVLSGRDLAPLGSNLPPVVILNACESGRIRKSLSDDVENDPASAAEAILNAGIMCFIATYWPVSDPGADIFADKFYEGVLLGMQEGGEAKSVGEAVLSARQAMKEAGENDWANYMLYGDPQFKLKKPELLQ